MENNQREYRSYLLRLWRVSDDGKNWRASLEEVQSGKLRGFSKMADLLDYLKVVTTPEKAEPEVQVEDLTPGS